MYAIVCFVAYDRQSVNWHRVQSAHAFLNDATHDAPFTETTYACELTANSKRTMDTINNYYPQDAK